MTPRAVISSPSGAKTPAKLATSGKGAAVPPPPPLWGGGPGDDAEPEPELPDLTGAIKVLSLLASALVADLAFTALGAHTACVSTATAAGAAGVLASAASAYAASLWERFRDDARRRARATSPPRSSPPRGPSSPSSW